MPLVQTRGAASAQGFGEFAQAATAITYIEDVFSCFLYTGTGSSQTITNNIDLSTKGGLTWIKGRSGTTGHRLTDTARGATKSLASETTAAEATETTGLTAFGTTGFTIGADADYNTSAATYVSWTFREQPKFFDVVTYTGNGSTKTISHSLGSVPGCIIVKDTSDTFSWVVYHRSNGNDKVMYLNGTQAVSTDANVWNSYTPTATDFQVGGSSFSNSNGDTYVAYIFAHNAGGFGLTGTDNVISCGTFTTDGSGNFSVNLGYEPQWVMIKSTNNTGVSAAQQNWIIMDSMRGLLTQSGNGLRLRANTAEAESSTNDFGPTATGFESLGNMSASAPFIYIAIRRGPMKVPTVGTSVFAPVTYTGNATARSISGLGFPPDLVFPKIRDNGGGFNGTMTDRLRGATNYLIPNDTSAEATNANYVTVLGQDGFSLGSGADVNRNTSTFISWNFRRAPSFFDEVCFTCSGSNTNLRISHNLAAVPELIIYRVRTGSSWLVYVASKGRSTYRYLNLTNADFSDTPNIFGTADPTTTDFALNEVGAFTGSIVAYLFATCAGVSKVGSYTGTGTTLQIDCGFTGGARFVLIKRTSTGGGGWYVWDTTRGIIAGNDPYLFLNSTAAEVTSTDYINTYSAGFEISSTAPAAINESGGSFIFLAIA
jgi:hypothetical protein